MTERRWARLSGDQAGLTLKFRVNPVSCGNSQHYERYLRLIARTDQAAGRGTTHLLIENGAEVGSERIVGFVTLRASSLVKVFDSYDEGHAALEIAELAVDEDFERSGVGSSLVAYAIKMAEKVNEKLMGIEYVTLCADPVVVPFYEKLNFLKMEDYYSMPREGWNVSCVPLMLKLP